MVYLAAIPQDINAAKLCGYQLAYITRRLGEPRAGRGGLMVFSDTGGNPEPPRAADLIAECKFRGCKGLALDFEGGFKQKFFDLAAELNILCASESLALIVNRRYRQPNAITLASSAQSSGSLRQRLARYGRNTMLEIERLAQDITLPAPQGRGLTVSRAELSRLTESRATFFSNELLARYFTYKDASGATHFVIYDDAVSISKKIALANSLGLYGVIMLYSEVRDIIHEIL